MAIYLQGQSSAPKVSLCSANPWQQSRKNFANQSYWRNAICHNFKVDHSNEKWFTSGHFHELNFSGQYIYVHVQEDS